MSHYVGYSIRGHQIGEGSVPRRTVNVLKREGTVTEPQPGAFQATEFGRQVAAIADYRDAMPPQVVCERSRNA